MEKISTGAVFLDKLLEGGYEKDIITTIYGPAGSGKTNLCILCAINTARLGKKVVYIDTYLETKAMQYFREITSKNISFENLEKYARMKGLNLLGTGDFQHPIWNKEIKSTLNGQDQESFNHILDNILNSYLNPVAKVVVDHRFEAFV